nr:hypothetical protein [Chloroflexota bacterium]
MTTMNSDVKPTQVWMQRLLLLASVLVFLAGVQLFVLSEHTDRFFAWTIKLPLTAAFLGAGYWASFSLEYLGARERTWARARVAVPGVLVFTTLTLVTTLLYFDKFHFGSADWVARAAAWSWLGVYGTVPLMMTAILVTHVRAPGGDPERQASMPGWMMAALSAQAVVMLALGLALFLAPELVAAVWWPWALTALAGRAVAAWLLGLGVAVAHSVWEADYGRVRAGTASLAVFGLLQFVALARYGSAVDWARPVTWGYMALMVSFVVVGVVGWASARGK